MTSIPSPLLRGCLLLVLALAACDCGTAPGAVCTSSADCPGGSICRDARCVPIPPVPDGSCAALCGTVCCDTGEICVDGLSCASPGGTCLTADDCRNDRYCHAGLGLCIPWGTPPSRQTDDTCTRLILAGVFAPSVQCEFRVAPAGDPFPAHLHVLTTPVVADFRIGRGPDEPPAPSIVAVFDDGVDGSSELPTGVIRILDGATCAQQAELGSLNMVSHSSPPAIGDLDGDGRPEIVAYRAGGGLVAFRYDPVAMAWSVLWGSTTDGVTPHSPTGGGWAGPSIYDLDDDGVPEVLREQLVYDATGRLLDESLYGPPVDIGLFTVVADVDVDGRAEMVRGDGVWQWDSATTAWVAEAWSPPMSSAGRVAIADFGDFPGAMGWPVNTPEVVVVENGNVRVQTLDGAVVFGPVLIPSAAGIPGYGGPPTIADFDGDGRPEFATAGADFYVVFDLDCGASPIGACASGRTDGVLWTQPSQDLSSNRTGSSVFDFEGDGRAEVVYGDECFLRVYDGETGDVVFSQYRSSCTWYENPVIADVDGDFNAEIVIGNNFNCGSASAGIACNNLEPRAVDPLFAGMRCDTAADCVSGTCDTGLCRCTMDAECCAGAGCALAGFVCAPPPVGTAGTGNTCRASHPQGALGIRVYSDSADRWVRSRIIWNQHAYHVTNVNDDGTIPSTSAAARNWQTPGLNNFRQNVQGSGLPGAAPDLTAAAITASCVGTDAALSIRVCNRGSEPVGTGMSVGFYDGEPDAGAILLCRALSTTVLDPGTCETVTCTATGVPEGTSVIAIADDVSAEGECFEANNRATGTVRCLL